MKDTSVLSSFSEVARAVSRIRNFGATNGIIVFWWRSFHSVHVHLARIFTSLFRVEFPLPSWLIEERTILIPKKRRAYRPKKYRLTTCLNMRYKIFTNVEVIKSLFPRTKGIENRINSPQRHLLTDRSICHEAQPINGLGGLRKII